MKVLLWLVLGLAVLVALAFLVGLTLPATHVAMVEATYRASPAEVWGVLTDIERWGEWNGAVDRMERLPGEGDVPAWRLEGGKGGMTLRVVESTEPSRLRTEVDAGVFRGSWTYTLEAVDGGTRVRIREEGEIPLPPFRLFMLGRDVNASARDFLMALGERLGEQADPAVVRT